LLNSWTSDRILNEIAFWCPGLKSSSRYRRPRRSLHAAYENDPNTGALSVVLRTAALTGKSKPTSAVVAFHGSRQPRVTRQDDGAGKGLTLQGTSTHMNSAKCRSNENVRKGVLALHMLRLDSSHRRSPQRAKCGSLVPIHMRCK
jgi:hypothetical protein